MIIGYINVFMDIGRVSVIVDSKGRCRYTIVGTNQEIKVGQEVQMLG